MPLNWCVGVAEAQMFAVDVDVYVNVDVVDELMLSCCLFLLAVGYSVVKCC